jgi:hypothetical protein
MFEITMFGVAILVAVIALLVSPQVRVICWDSFAHPRYTCRWVRDGNTLRELKAGIDYPVEGEE